jgi:prolyl-tRNA editing enzyme YbaK/EbsC (Cys-tRNA(Pro) deacylase)
MIEDPAVARVKEFLARNLIDAQVEELPASTHTARDAASALKCTTAEIAKTVVFESRPSLLAIVVIACGDTRIDERALAEAVGEDVFKASADFVRTATGFAPGGVSPLALPGTVSAIVDSRILEYEYVWIAAGSAYAVCKIAPEQLINACNGRCKNVAMQAKQTV